MEKFWSGGVKTFFSPTNNAKAIGKIDKYFWILPSLDT